MSDREGTPEDFARMAAQARGQDLPSKQGQNRRLVEAIHPPEPEPDPDLEAEEFVEQLFSPKAGHVELIRAIHGSEEE